MQADIFALERNAGNESEGRKLNLNTKIQCEIHQTPPDRHFHFMIFIFQSLCRLQLQVEPHLLESASFIREETRDKA